MWAAQGAEGRASLTPLQCLRQDTNVEKENALRTDTDLDAAFHSRREHYFSELSQWQFMNFPPDSKGDTSASEHLIILLKKHLLL